MPKGTRVHRCVDKLKGKPGINPYAVCQASTKQSFATGKGTRKSDKKPVGSKKAKSESLEARLHALLMGESSPRVGIADTKLESKLTKALAKHFDG